MQLTAEQKFWLKMKLTLFLLIAGCLQVCANGYAQTISLSLKDAALESVFLEVQKQSGYSFMYPSSLIKNAKLVTVEVKQATVEEVLKICAAGQPFSYSIIDKTIILKEKDKDIMHENSGTPIEVRGRVINENGDPVPGATVQIKGSQSITTTDANGEFLLNNISPTDILIISGAEIQPQEIRVAGRTYVQARINAKVGELDQVIMMAYGQTTQRLNTGNIGKVSGEEINRQPVSNPLAALQGRVAGLIVNQNSGQPGGSFKIQIRGQSSLGAAPNALYPVSNDPLIIIDGVPTALNNTSYNQIPNAANVPGSSNHGGLSPLSIVNPADIESIEVLKDADATAIYGSRGANGVILITTRRAKTRGSRFNVSAYTGITHITRGVDFLNTQQYLEMRKEAFQNDGTTPTAGNAPDLLVFDSLRYTDFSDYFMGNAGIITNIQASFEAGTDQTRFVIGAGYIKEDTKLPGGTASHKSNISFSMNHTSANRKLNIIFQNTIGVNKTNTTGNDMTRYLFSISPNYPAFYDESGALVWEYEGVGISNYMANAQYRNDTWFGSINSNMQIAYLLTNDITFRSSFGFNGSLVNEHYIIPKASQNPKSNPFGYAQFADRKMGSWIVEPQAEYKKQIGKGRLSILMGATLQQSTNSGSYLYGDNYTNDAQLGSIQGAGVVYGSDNYYQYKYNAGFGRINYQWNNTYLVNLTGRRDGSSRFGPGKKFANFGAVGLGWIFTNEQLLKKYEKVLSYGKLRGSYGITGNDQIGNYIYLDTWRATTQPYQSTVGVRPTGLFNPDFSWEVNRKAEIGLELGFLKDKVLMSGTYYRSRTGNQLVQYNLASQAGFSSIRAVNFPALVQNAGWEMSIAAKIISRPSFSWSTSANLTIARNKLLKFPGIETSPYASTYIVGQSLSVARGYRFIGVNPTTGIYDFEDIDKDGVVNSQDYVVIGNLNPRIFGGLSQNFSYKRITVTAFISFEKKTGRGITYYYSSIAIPGARYNQPVAVMDRWQKPGDITTVQKFSMTSGGPVHQANMKFITSDGVIEDASYARLKNLSISYDFPDVLLKKTFLKAGRIYMNAHNVFTITRFTGDPETGNFQILPPAKVFSFGFQFSF